MAAKDLIQTAHKVVDAFNTNDWEGMKQLMTADAVYKEIGTQRTLKNPDEIIEALKGWKEAMPDAKGTVTNAFGNGNKVVQEVKWEGTQTGPFAGPAGTIPASGKKHVTSAAWIADFEDGKIKESRQYFDMLGILQQIGAMPQ